MKKTADKMDLLMVASVSIISMSRMIETDGSTLQEFIRGVVVGIAGGFCCVYLWNFGKRRKNMG